MSMSNTKELVRPTKAIVELCARWELKPMNQKDFSMFCESMEKIIGPFNDQWNLYGVNTILAKNETGYHCKVIPRDEFDHVYMIEQSVGHIILEAPRM